MADRLLDRINEPGDLKGLTHEELAQVAQEARDTIISVITERGGHLASNLGVVELTLALHRIFDSPKDSIVWDTTNQTYTHKLVTGRREEFQAIRLEGGLSGFGEPNESAHDALVAGHAGTGLSIALGIAMGAANRGTGSWTAAVVGDGAMTSGSSFEALNNIVHLNPEKLIVILNDNGMSISENVGILTNWRKSVITHPEFNAMLGRVRSLSEEGAHGRAHVQSCEAIQHRPHRPHHADDVLDRDGIPVPGPHRRPRLQAAGRDPPAGDALHRPRAAGTRGHPQGPRLRTRGGRPGQVPPAQPHPWGTARGRPPTPRCSPRR